MTMPRVGVNAPELFVRPEPLRDYTIEDWCLATTDLDFDEWCDAQVHLEMQRIRATAEKDAYVEQDTRDLEEAKRLGREAELLEARRAKELEATLGREVAQKVAGIRREVTEELAKYSLGEYDAVAGTWMCAYTGMKAMTVDEIVAKKTRELTGRGW